MSTNHSATLAVEVEFSMGNNIKILVESPNYQGKRKRKKIVGDQRSLRERN